LTNYPKSVSRAIAEHHERLDGSGYPHALQGDALSLQGRLLAVTEAALGALRSPHRGLLHASVALRAVPGEFDLHWVGQVAQAACAQPPGTAVMEPADIQARLEALSAVLSQAEDNVAHLAGLGTLPGLNGPLRLAHYLLTRLRTGWNESGLWNPQALVNADAAEVEALEDEIYFRLRAVQRATLLLAGPLPEAESAALNELCDSLAMG
jgi:hypothetical protein